MAKIPLRKPKKKANPLKAAKVTYIDYKDTALLRKFISDRGKIRARRVTGVSVQQQPSQPGNDPWAAPAGGSSNDEPPF